MPRCYDCRADRPVLWSMDCVRPDDKGRPVQGSYALCASCWNREAEGQGRTDRVREADRR